MFWRAHPSLIYTLRDSQQFCHVQEMKTLRNTCMRFCTPRWWTHKVRSTCLLVLYNIIVILIKLRAFVGLNCNKISNFNSVRPITFDSFIITDTLSVNAYYLKFLPPNVNTKKLRVSLIQLICKFCGYLMFRASSGCSPVQTACTPRGLQEVHAEEHWSGYYIFKHNDVNN